MDLGFQIEPGFDGAIYGRVSSKEQEKGYSLDFQLKGGRESAQKHGVPIAREWKVRESATEEGREKFNEFLKYLRDHPRVKYAFIAKVDRMTRNYTDMGLVEELVKHHGKVFIFFHEGFVYHKNSSLSDSIRLDASGMIGRLFVRDLSEKTKRGMEEKAARGELPGPAPKGYLCDKLTKQKVPDPLLRKWIVEMHELAARNESIDSILKKLRDAGCPMKLHRSGVAYIIRNPFYAGPFEWPRGSGKWRPYVHEPIVSHALKVAAIKGLERLNKPKYGRHGFTYRGMIQCGGCGCLVIAEIKKQKYIYWHCSWMRPCTNRDYIRQEDLEIEFERNLTSIHLDKEKTARALKYLEASSANVAAAQVLKISALKQELGRTKNRMDKAYDDKLDGKIPENLWQQKNREWHDRLMTLQEQIQTLEKASPADYMPKARAILELSNVHVFLFKFMDAEKKRRLLDSVYSNFSLNAKKLTGTYKKPFELVAQMASCPNWLRA
ncbi:MAG: recombinase family protein [Elusimicrobiota bacterium]